MYFQQKSKLLLKDIRRVVLISGCLQKRRLARYGQPRQSWGQLQSILSELPIISPNQNLAAS